MPMKRNGTLYTVLHYGVLLSVIGALVAAIELTLGSVPLWLGVLVAVLVGVLYPTITRRMGVAPSSWQ